MSIRDINTASKYGDLSEEQQQRWQKFAAFLKYNGWSVFQLTQASSVLQRLSCEVEYWVETELQAVTAQQLQQWAEELLNPKDLPIFNELMALAAKFAIENKPLVSLMMCRQSWTLQLLLGINPDYFCG
eukprot:jgi/Chrzof1/10585/Cz05g04120.t1